ncbi:PEP-CTERM protein-sorting domain-containing protein/MYXO-CTERM domain-containing protein [Duganella sp. CF402]|uniref:FxDxF family PEP-CTERM protein n=1 Tax=unclassified Duganella TaxID=2636909 RepID=UPI0008D26ACE|nr:MULTISPECIES: FxDxF family PEP-CTERM protein [unclassified Duganella]RZT10573.1 putative secreted protein with PEP-CTERM sorting signal/MYXO-CTERM domain-containing protein [Duganella sp. BK701]SEL07689.1 PEP-CTERM protein-sorting domain-containing protein/MYXO-CTERM domain-containing protein [Duganella sp. CF402]
MFAKKLAIAAALLTASSVHAATIFADNFDSNTDALNASSFANGWTVSDGTVDIIGPTGGWDLIPGNGYYIDLDGSTGKAGLFSNSIAVSAGQTYILSFSLAGNQRASYGTGGDSVTVNFGTNSQVIGRTETVGFQTFSLSYTALADGNAVFSFRNAGGDNIGALLDNVSVAAVPEPTTYAMLLAGLGLVGAAARRRRNG